MLLLLATITTLSEIENKEERANQAIFSFPVVDSK